ncbi:hypothetical protein KY290_038420 [Solanum tuberosum]|uniref:Uncharacterized protein n=1 Tax=Solanum tuberosum TaxID=4113 RepID=A0ABQ7U234_SOLTU|nr:hypothetical protein KY290_038420 [Solanum tuberosum]
MLTLFLSLQRDIIRWNKNLRSGFNKRAWYCGSSQLSTCNSILSKLIDPNPIYDVNIEKSLSKSGAENAGRTMEKKIDSVNIRCGIESMTTLSFPFLPPPTAAFAATRLMLKDVMGRLRTGGYTLVALAMRVKYPELADLKSMTVFAMDDLSIFGIGIGHEYVANLGFHIVPNRLLMASELAELAPNTELMTMDKEGKLVVTTAGGNGPLVPMRINYVKVKNYDLVYNKRIVVHGLSTPFPRIHLHHRSADVSIRISDGSLGQ